MELRHDREVIASVSEGRIEDTHSDCYGPRIDYRDMSRVLMTLSMSIS